MGEHQKVFNPILVESLYESDTVTYPSNICDGLINTYGYLTFSGGKINGMHMFYNFSGIPANATLVSAMIGGSSCRWKTSSASLTHGVQLNSIRYYGQDSTIITDAGPYNIGIGAFASLSYEDFSPNTEYAFNRTEQFDLISSSNNISIDMEKLLSTYGTPTRSRISVVISFNYMAIYGYPTVIGYLNMMPITIGYSLPDCTLNFNASTGGTVDKSSYTGDAESSPVTVTATANNGYVFSHWSDDITNTNPVRTFTPTTNATYTAIFKENICTISFDSNSSSTYSNLSITGGNNYGTLPTPTKDGYEFLGWYKTDTCCSSAKYNTSNFQIIGREYMYTDKIAVHVDAYMNDWSEIASASGQIISCTEAGGWGIGYGANTDGHGTEIYTSGYTGIDFGIQSLSSGWHTFDMVFNNGTFTGYVDGVLKNQKSTQATAITYYSGNVIFVGAEASSNATTPSGGFFNGIISDVLISNQGSKLTAISSSDIVTGSCTLHAMWRLKSAINNIYIGSSQITGLYVGSTPVKEVYVGSTKIYG